MELYKSFWQGSGLTPLAWACYSSFALKKKRVLVYSYDPVELPVGVERADASEIVPRTALFYALDSYSPFSNRFRYTLLLGQGGWWIDADVVYLTDPDREEVVFAWEDANSVNVGQMKFPPDHPVLQDCVKRLDQISLDNISWGDLGPKLFHKVVQDHGLLGAAKEARYLYPIHWSEAFKLWLPDLTTQIKEATKESPFMHAWGAMHRQFGIDISRAKPPQGSYLDQLYTETGVYERYELEDMCLCSLKISFRDWLSQEWIHPYRSAYDLNL
jgi:hypothetical protein